MKPLFSPPHQAAQIQAMLQQGWALHQSGQYAQAQQLYERVLKLQPKNFDAWHLSGVLAIHTRDYKKAVELITKALKIDRDHASAYNNRGAAYVELKDPEMALLNFNKAIALNPSFEEAYNNRGNIHFRASQHEAAIADFQKALALKPAYFEAHNNMANALSEAGRNEEAAASYRRALALQPSLHEARWNLGMCLLRMGDFENGWRESEARLDYWVRRGLLTPPAQPRWQGSEPLNGKTIFLQCEQGLGDNLQFGRYLDLVRSRSPARIILEVPDPLMPLLAHLRDLPDVALIGRGSAPPAFDVYCPLMSLPLAFKTDLGNMPPPIAGIHGQPEKVAQWREILGERRKPRVGIVWSGNASHIDDRKRSMALQAFLPLLSDDVEWISLHKEVRADDAPTLLAHPMIRHFGAHQHDFTDAAAMCELLDLVITVDTSIAHLAGSMGKPVWILLAFNADWRWLLERTDSPWYPSAKLYRQRHNGDWAGLLTEVAKDVRAHFA